MTIPTVPATEGAAVAGLTRVAELTQATRSGPTGRPRGRRGPHPVPKALRGWVIPLLLLTLWWAAYHFEWTDSILFAPLDKVGATALRLGGSGELWHALGASLVRDLLGFVVGAAAGLLLGSLLGVSRLFENLVGPSFHTLKQISLFAWIPLISMSFGPGEMAKVAFVAMAAFFPVVLNTFEGIRSVPRELVEVAKVFAFSRRQLFTGVILRAALPSISTGISLALIYSWLATLGAEYLLSAGPGIGNLLTDGREHFWMDQVLLGVIIVGAVGFALNWVAASVETRLLGWRGTSTARY